MSDDSVLFWSHKQCEVTGNTAKPALKRDFPSLQSLGIGEVLGEREGQVGFFCLGPEPGRG